MTSRLTSKLQIVAVFFLFNFKRQLNWSDHHYRRRRYRVTITNEKQAEVCLTAPDCEVNTNYTIDDVIVPGHQYNAKKYRKPWVGHQCAGGPDTTKLYDPDAPIPEPTGILQPDRVKNSHEDIVRSANVQI
jgi:hypothetical protein